MPRHTAMRCLALATLLAVTSSSAGAQFTQFPWTLSGSSYGSGTLDDALMHVVGPNDPSDPYFCFDGPATWFETTAAVDGTVKAHFDWDNQDFCIGSWLADHPFYLVDGVETAISTGMSGFEYVDFEKDVEFTVAAGETFGFGVGSIDCSCGPGVLDVSAFSFTPLAWPVLGAGLAGVNGLPALDGYGSMESGDPYSFSLVDAAPLASAWLVLGTAPLKAPFKGGILVPEPAVIVALTTSPVGRIILNGTWPAGVPSGLTLVMQYWIADAAGPSGFSASNGLAPVTP